MSRLDNPQTLKEYANMPWAWVYSTFLIFWLWYLITFYDTKNWWTIFGMPLFLFGVPLAFDQLMFHFEAKRRLMNVPRCKRIN